jgi:hypothetical protein
LSLVKYKSSFDDDEDLCGNNKCGYESFFPIEEKECNNDEV